jgi:hypothetical protein
VIVVRSVGPHGRNHLCAERDWRLLSVLILESTSPPLKRWGTRGFAGDRSGDICGWSEGVSVDGELSSRVRESKGQSVTGIGGNTFSQSAYEQAIRPNPIRSHGCFHVVLYGLSRGDDL